MSALLFALPGRGVIAVGGADRKRWLDGMLTCDVKKLAAGAGAHGLLLTPQGRIVAELHVLDRGEELWLETEAGAIPSVIERLARYVIADDVTLSDRTPALARLAIEGEGAGGLLGAALPSREHGVASARLAGVEVAVARYGFTGVHGLQLFVPRANEGAVGEALVAAGAQREGAEAFERLRVEAGTPWPGRELDESVLPAEARLDGVAVAVDKGCYTGQEVVARMRSRKRASQLLVGLRFAGAAPPPRGTALASERGDAGSVTSAVLSPRFGAIGLGYVPASLAEPGTVLRAAGGEEATVVALPFANETLGSDPKVSVPGA